MKIHPIPPDKIHDIWHLCEKYLAAAAEHGEEYNADQLKVLLVQGHQVLVLVSDGDDVVGAMTVLFVNYPQLRVATVTAFGGKSIVNQEVLVQLRDWVRLNGASRIRCYVRDSVARLLHSKVGFEQRSIMTELTL